MTTRKHRFGILRGGLSGRVCRAVMAHRREKKSLFAQNLKDLRDRRGLTQKQLAREIGRSQGTISNWENDITDPRVWEADELAAYFQVDVEALKGTKPLVFPPGPRKPPRPRKKRKPPPPEAQTGGA